MAQEIPVLRGAQTLIPVDQLVHNVCDSILEEFIQLSANGERLSDPDKKKQLLLHLHSSRQSLLRILALLNWKGWKVLAELVDHERVMDIAASHVRTISQVVGQMRQQAAGRIMAGSYLNMYDVNTALEVLTTGTYHELPSIMLHRPPLFQPPPASLARQRARLEHVTHLVRARLVQVPLPPGLKVVSISGGTAVLRAEGLYEAKLTLVPSEPLLEAQPGGEGAAAGGAAAAEGLGAGDDAGEVSGGAEAAMGAAAAKARADPAVEAAAAQRWKWRLIHFVLQIGVPFYDARQPGQILNTCNFHMVLAADNAAYLKRKKDLELAKDAGEQQQQQGGQAAAATPQQPAASTFSDTTTVGGGAGCAGGGGAATLAGALRRVEDDEAGAPLAVMHAILTDVAGRLLADELAAAARALAAPGSRWHGHIAVKPPQLLRPGVRIEYWTSVPPLLSLRATPVAGEEGTPLAAKPGPPFLELGMGEGGCVEVLHSPSLLHKPMAISKLRLDTFRVNVEEVLMRAANMSAQFQLLQIRQELKGLLLEALGTRYAATSLRLTTLAKELWCRDASALTAQQQQADGAAAPPSPDHPADGAGVAPMDVDGGSAAAAAAKPQPPPIPSPAAPPPEVSGPLAEAGAAAAAANGGSPEGVLVLLNAPVLEYLVAGTTELKLGKHLFSGRLTLRPGQDERDEGSLDHAAAIAASEAKVNAAAAAAYNKASGEPYPALRALQDACRLLARVLARAHSSTDATHFIQAARRAALHISRLPHGLMEAFAAANPGLALDSRSRGEVATWALQSVPFPPSFPSLDPALPPDTPPLRVPRCLAFFLQSRLSLHSPHVLVVCSCNKQLMPLKVLSCIPVPPSVHRLPEHLIEVAREASRHSAGHGGAAAPDRTPVHSAGGAPPSTPAGLTGASPAGNASTASLIASGVSGSHSKELTVRLSDAPSPMAVDVAGGLVGKAGAGGGVPASGPEAAGQQGAASGGHQRSGTGGSGSGSGSGNAAGAGTGTASHGPGRPTGQQVAVMLAQQQLSSVVRWCRRRMVWEVLLVQLQAVGAAFVEMAGPAPCTRVRVTRVAGVPLPCRIARRPGLRPSRVGPTCLELELGPDALAGQVTARLYGRFLCSPTCVPYDGSYGGAGGPQGFAGSPTAGFVLEGQGPASHGSSVVCLKRQYCLERGDSALTLVQEVASILRMQVLLARLEMTVRPGPLAAGYPQRLAVLSAAAGTAAAVQHAPQGRRCGAAAVGGSGSAAAGANGNGMGSCTGVTHEGPGWQRGPGGELGAPRPLQHHNTNHVHGYGYGHQQGGSDGGGCKPAGNGTWQDGVSEDGSYGGPPLKRIKTEPGLADGAGAGGYGNETNHVNGPGSRVGLDGGHQGHGQGRGQQQGPGEGGGQAAHGGGALAWEWPLIGTVALEHYTVSGAILRFTPAAAASSSATAHEKQQQQQGNSTSPSQSPLLLHISWLPRHDSRAQTTAPPTAPAATPSTPGYPQSPGSPPFTRPATPIPSTPSVSTPPPPGTAPASLPGTASSGAGEGLPAVRSVAPQALAAHMAAPLALLRPGGGGGTAGGSLSTTTRGVLGRHDEPFGSSASDVVLCTLACCSEAHTLPAEFLHVLEEFAEAGEEGKLLDAVAVAAWPLAGFSGALRPAVLLRHGLSADMDVRYAVCQPPYCHRILCRRRAGGSYLLVDLVCQAAAGRAYIKVTLPQGFPQQQQQQQQQQQPSAQAAQAAAAAAAAAGGTDNPGAAAAAAMSAGSAGLLVAVQYLAVGKLGRAVSVSVGGRGALPTGLGYRPRPAPGPGCPLWLLVPNDSVQQVVELVYGVMRGPGGEQQQQQQQAQGQGGQQGQGQGGQQGQGQGAAA